MELWFQNGIIREEDFLWGEEEMIAFRKAEPEEQVTDKQSAPPTAWRYTCSIRLYYPGTANRSNGWP